MTDVIHFYSVTDDDGERSNFALFPIKVGKKRRSSSPNASGPGPTVGDGHGENMLGRLSVQVGDGLRSEDSFMEQSDRLHDPSGYGSHIY